MATMQDCFQGRVQQREYAQFVAKETLPTALVDGKPIGWYNRTYTARFVAQTFVFLGLTETQANSTSAITVTDVSGTSYTFTPVNTIVDGSSGSATFEKERVDVERVRMSPHMWSLRVTRTGGKLYAGNTAIIDPPTWAAGWLA